MTAPKSKTRATTSRETTGRKKLALKKDGLKDLTATSKAKGVKGGANYSRNFSGGY
jgi:hypothetical protein